MKIIAIVLAGGKSSRMGHDKALLEINGESLLLKICRNALQVADSVYVVARSQEQYQSAIAPNLDLTQISLVLDQQFDGALVGFCQGIEAIANTSNNSPDWILLLACDLPNLQGYILRLWASQLANLPENIPERAIAYLPRYLNSNSQKQWEPLCGFYRWQCRDSLAEFVVKGGRSFQKWLGNQEVVEIANVPISVLFNCNTPEDFRSTHRNRLRS